MNKLLLLTFILLYQISYSQINITGTIIDGHTKETLIGANVIVKGTQNGTSTNLQGKYTLTSNQLPVTLSISYLGYKSIEIEINTENTNLTKLFPKNKTLKEIKIIDNRITQKQKESALTVESLDMIAIQQTPSINFYDGLGSLKAVDITAASLGFKVINTRGFNSTSPVRSLQIIDGVDNQSPGLNFSLGNFLGSSELDIMKVEIIQGASSAYYGPNAFNGVINMITISPFIKEGLSIQYKFGERQLFENAIRFANKFQNSKGQDVFAFKINLAYMQAIDWEANNMAAVDGSISRDNPGGYDAVNRYGDEDIGGNLNDVRNDANLNYFSRPGLRKFHRTGYLEKDIVDYNTRNLKAQTSLHYMINPKTEVIYGINYSTGTTVYQGDNRFSLKNIQFWQNKLEIKEKDKFFIRAYRTQEDAGDSYDAVSTAIKLQEHNLTDNDTWYSYYKSNYETYFPVEKIGDFYPITYYLKNLDWSFTQISNGYKTDIDGNIIYDQLSGLPIIDIAYIVNNNELTADELYNISDSVINANTDILIAAHDATRIRTDEETNRLVPGEDDFNEMLATITSKTAIEGGTGFYDKSALNHIHAERQFNINNKTFKVGGNFRQYRPNTKGSLFMDTTENIKNNEIGVYSGFEINMFNKRLKVSSTLRSDKNENFDLNFSPAMSIVYTPNKKDVFRLSFSSAIRNPTLADQYLYYNVGRAILIGNLTGHGTEYNENLVTIESLMNYLSDSYPSKDNLDFFSVKPIQPEKAKSIEIGLRTTLLDKIYLDANYYSSSYTDFIGYKIGAKFSGNDVTDLDGNEGYDMDRGSIQAYRMAANAENIVTTQGAAIGINYYLHPNYSISGNYSWNKLNEKGTEDPIIPAYNTPEHKFNLSLNGKDLHLSEKNSILRSFSFNINYKWVEGFTYEGSPQFTGHVPTYDLLDIQLSKNLTELNAILKIGSSNILDNKHYEVYGGPYIGRMTYCSIIFEIK